jgi:hypothetical protein
MKWDTFWAILSKTHLVTLKATFVPELETFGGSYKIASIFTNYRLIAPPITLFVVCLREKVHS